MIDTVTELLSVLDKNAGGMDAAGLAKIMFNENPDGTKEVRLLAEDGTVYSPTLAEIDDGVLYVKMEKIEEYVHIV